MIRTTSHRPPRLRGFTLIELMIAIAVVSILGMLAYPSYLDSVRKGRRSDAVAAMMALQQAQERWRSNSAAYSANLGELGIPAVSSAGMYDISVGAAPGGVPMAIAYVATAVGKGGTTQADDKSCRKMSVKLEGGNLSYAGCGACGAFSYEATHLCWAK